MTEILRATLALTLFGFGACDQTPFAPKMGAFGGGERGAETGYSNYESAKRVRAPARFH